jgi:hypothetical protein
MALDQKLGKFERIGIRKLFVYLSVQEPLPRA